MAYQQTCGKGLAERSGIPATLAELIDALAANLETHMPAIDRSEESGRQEYEAYGRLHKELGEIARRLRETAHRMAGYGDLPMPRHDPEVMASPQVLEAFQTYVRIEEELITMLEQALLRDRAMLTRGTGTVRANTS